jgi:anti-sigma factor RsiW
MMRRATARPPARCLALLDQLSKYVDDELPPRARQAIDAHCRDCARCRRMIAGLRRTIDVCRAAGSRPIPAKVRRRAAASVARLLRSK